MKIKLPDKSEKIFSPKSYLIEDIVTELGYNPGSVIVVKNGHIVPEDITAEESDELRVILVSHGG
jgi:sulfur carrier protein ThiS